jgi:hypothetical protein
MTDAGEPGNNDSISITLWQGSTLLFSSNWNGAQSVEQLLNPGNGNGNLVVHQLQVLLGAPVRGQGGVETLTPEMLPPMIAEALARWQGAGFTPEQLSVVKDINFQVADLPAGNLGWTTAAGSIILDRSAAGYGWFIDRTPADDSEFAAGVVNSPARGHMDLLTVVTHEIGHVLGFPDNHSGGLMDEALPVGVRRVPGPSNHVDVVTTYLPDHGTNLEFSVKSFNGPVSSTVGTTNVQVVLGVQRDGLGLSTNLLAALLAEPVKESPFQPSSILPGLQYDSSPLTFEPSHLLPVEELPVRTVLARNTEDALSEKSAMAILDCILAEEGNVAVHGFVDDLWRSF